MPDNQKNDREIRITNINSTLKRELTNIAKNMHVDLGPFLKIKLQEIRDSYSPDMRVRKNDTA